jgi:serine/threonine-protein kinase
VALAGSLLVPRGAGGEPKPQRRLLASLGIDATLTPPNEPAVAIAPGGGRIAVVAARDGKTGIYIRDLDRFEERRLEGTENGSGPFFSPDGEWLAFFQDGDLKKVQVASGPALTVTGTSALHRGGCWGPGDRIVLTPSITSGILEVPAAGGEARELTTLDADAHERTHRFPQFVPGGRWVIFTVGTDESPEYYDDARIDAVDRETGERHAVLENASMARALPSGHLLYARGGVLFAAPFDLGAAEVTGGSIPVQEGVRSMQQTGAADFDVGLDGTLVFVPGESQTLLSHLVWVDREGRMETITDAPEPRLQVVLSPDGAFAAVIRATEGANDLWVRDMARGISSRLTFSANVLGAVWSPDSRRIAFASRREGQLPAVYVIPRDGSREEELLWAADNPLLPNDWTPDGRNLLVQRGSTTGGADLWVLPLDGDEEPYPFLDRDFDDRSARISPDGRWVAHVSYQSGRNEVYVRPFPGPGGRWQISMDGGREPRWSADGRELFFRNGSETLVATVDTSSGFRAERPRVLFDRDLYSVVPFQYSPSPDGERFLAIQRVGSDASRSDIAVVLHWVDELRRLVPAGTGG